MAMGLIVEYLRRTRSGVTSPSICLEDLTTQPSISDMAGVGQRACAGHVLRWALSEGIFVGKLTIPRDIRQLLFCEALPEALEQHRGALPITILGDFHQLCLSSPLDSVQPIIDERRAKGAHYTPPALVDYMVARAFQDMAMEQSSLENLRVLDPSCGCGAFLIAVLRHLSTVTGKAGQSRLIGRLYGSDIDSRAVALTRVSLILSLCDEFAAVGGLQGLTSVLRRQLATRDYLEGKTWACKRFDLIVGGPPFIRVEQLHKANPRAVAQYRCLYQTARTGQFDLYMPFVEKSIGLLASGGRLAFSVSASFLRSNSGSELRRVLGKDCQVVEVVEFEDGNVYPDASVQIALIMARKGSGSERNSRTRYVFIPEGRPIRKQLTTLLRPGCRSVDGSKVVRVALRNAPSNDWNLNHDRDRAFLAQVEAVGTPLGQLPVDLRLGMCTGADDVFLLKAIGSLRGRMVRLMCRNGEGIDLEAALVRTILRGRYVKTSALQSSDYVCVFPYDEKGDVLTERVLRRDFPRTYEYLCSHKSRLRRRRLCSQQRWYSLRKVDVASHLAKPKFITPVVCSPQGFLLDSKGVLCHQGILTITPRGDELDIHYLLGLFNSKIFWRYISLRAVSMGKGRRVLRLHLAKTLPVLLPENRKQLLLVSSIARSVSSMQKACSSKTILTETNRINELVHKLYGLDATPSR
ncbi:MAG: N-6 DNA methylase [Phycisphaerae bacterium]|nr:N-6 DNA methylase [Phycisphaerae bacterium]